MITGHGNMNTWRREKNISRSAPLVFVCSEGVAAATCLGMSAG